MAMNMRQAFGSEFMTRMIRYEVHEGNFDEFNEWQEGANTKRSIVGRIKTGNEFSQFEEGVARVSTEGGERFSDYRSLYINLDRYSLEMGDKIYYDKKYFNVLQMSTEDAYGFRGFLLEADKDWSPS